jgi:DnaJ-class molecular chaperone
MSNVKRIIMYHILLAQIAYDLFLVLYPLQAKTKAFKNATHAYDVLSNEDLRRQYDSTVGLDIQYGAYQHSHTSGHGHNNKSSWKTTSRRSKVYAPSQPPPGPGGRVYDFKAWNMAHYGDEGISYEGVGGAESSSRRSSRLEIADRDNIVKRMHLRRMERRAAGVAKPPPPQSSCSIQ